MKKYKYNEETTIVLSESQWVDFYNENVDKTEYPDFLSWWTDMLKMGLINAVV